MKYGFELEAFCTTRDLQQASRTIPCLVPYGLPFDECGWLAEIRSEPHTDITKAIFFLKAEQAKVERQAARAGIKLVYVPLMEIPRDLKVQAARTHSKGLISYRNIYGYETHKNPTKLQTASLHVSFTNEKSFNYDTCSHSTPPVVTRNNKFNYPGFVDHAKIITTFDRAFKAEIAKAKRNPGFYEVKGDGRIEYRSLPNDVSLDKVEQVLFDLEL